MQRFRVIVVMTLLGGVLLGLGFSPQATLAADITVTDCTRTGLVTAISNAGPDGYVTFNCASPTINFFSMINIQASVTIDGSNNGNPITLDGNNQSRFFLVSNGAKLTLQHITLKDGYARSDSNVEIPLGGALLINYGSEAEITDVTFESNEADAGGAISNSGKLTISQSTFNGNSAQYGGAIFNDASAEATITQTTFTSNHVEVELGESNGGAISSGGKFILNQSRFEGNSADGNGGAINFFWPAYNAISRTSFVNNQATLGGAIMVEQIAGVSVVASTFTNNAGSALYLISQTTNYVGWSTFIQTPMGGTSLYLSNSSITLEGVIFGGVGTHCGFFRASIADTYTISNDASCGLDGEGSQQNVSDLGLGPLTTTTINGVEQSYFPLVEGSLAINGSLETCDTTADDDTDSDPDQLGTPRPQAGKCDIGAFELVNNAPAVEAGGPYTGVEDEAVNLSGSASDPENDQITSQWSYAFVSGADPGTSCTFGDATQPATTITCDGAGNFLVTLTVSDSWHEAVTDQASVTIAAISTTTLCANRWNGALRMTDQCHRSEVQITVSRDSPATLCINNWDQATRIGQHCTSSEHQIIATGDDTIPVCINRWNFTLRAGTTHCTRSEFSDWL